MILREIKIKGLDKGSKSIKDITYIESDNGECVALNVDELKQVIEQRKNSIREELVNRLWNKEVIDLKTIREILDGK